jgi:hypothetical protein
MGIDKNSPLCLGVDKVLRDCHSLLSCLIPEIVLTSRNQGYLFAGIGN